MNIGVGAASAVGAVVGLFAGAFAGKALGGSETELVGASLAGTALGAGVGAVLTAPDVASSTTTTTSTTGALPRGMGAPSGLGAANARAWKGVAPANPLAMWNGSDWTLFYGSYNLPQAAVNYTTTAQVQTLAQVIAAISARVPKNRWEMPNSALSMMQRLHTAAAQQVARRTTALSRIA